MTPKKAYMFMIDAELDAALKDAKSEEPELSEGAIIREALREWLQRRKAKSDDEFIRELRELAETPEPVEPEKRRIWKSVGKSYRALKRTQKTENENDLITKAEAIMARRMKQAGRRAKRQGRKTSR